MFGIFALLSVGILGVHGTNTFLGAAPGNNVSRVVTQIARNATSPEWQVSYGTTNVVLHAGHRLLSKRLFTVSLYSFLTMYLMIPLAPIILDVVVPLNESRPLWYLYQTQYYVDQEKYFVWITLHTYATTILTITTIVAVDTMFVGYVQHICGVLRIIGHRIENLTTKRVDPDDEVYTMSKEEEHRCYREIAFCIDHHYRIIDYAAEWYSLSNRNKHLLRFAMMRTLEPQKITAGKLYVMSMENFGVISIVALGAEADARENATRRLHEFCSVELTKFWACANSTLSAAAKNEHWVGRGCCHLALYPICRSVCALAGSQDDLKGSCRLSDEPEFFGCLERREDGERCCSNVSNSTCGAICREIFHKPGQHSSRKLYSTKGCFHQVPKCLKNVVETTSADNPLQYLHCCDKAKTPGCLEVCKKTLYTATTTQGILEPLSEKCERIKLSQLDPFWSCLLQLPGEKSARLPLDIGRLTCCSKAVNSTCRELCWNAFQSDWTQAWSRLETFCLAGSGEDELRRCLDDAAEPCEMGCSGLDYCARYNYRPTTLFRTCSSSLDAAAERESGYWSRGGIIRGLTVQVRADPACPAESLRAASCLLQLRPCESRIHETRLCREDCLELMASCVDWSTVTGPHTASTLCSKLSPSRPDQPCVSLKPFLEDPGDIERALLPAEDITTPCKKDSCPAGQLCVVEPHTGNFFRCQPSCSLGEMSTQLVPIGTWIQVPREERLDRNAGCHRIYQCTSRGLDKRRDLNCYNSGSCWVQDRSISHRSAFYLGCNPCHCFEGEVTCSRKTCGEIRPPSLPCDCPLHYVPLCGRLGVTYASACLAKCAGMSANEVEFGSCSTNDPCASQPCPRGEKCLRRSRVCLSPVQKPCKQYQCVPADCNIHQDNSGPVCDRDNREHRNACALVHSGAILAYRGPCLLGCSLRGPVCGINGEVYASECAAWADKTVVDYPGNCVAVGLISDEAKSRCGYAVQCPPLAVPGCIGATPPGACCPVCGGAARLFYSRKQLDRIFYVMTEEADKDAVTLESMLNALSRQIRVVECSLRGAVTPEGDIFVIAQPVAKKPSNLQLKACVAEMQKLVTRITERSPRVVAEVPLGSLIRAEIVHSQVSAAIRRDVSFALISFTLLVTYSIVT